MQIKKLLIDTQNILKANNIDEAGIKARLLIKQVFNLDTASLYTKENMEVSIENKKRVTVLIEKVLKNEPIQYLMGKIEFYGLEFVIEPGVLIPRAETEILVETLIREAQKITNTRTHEHTNIRIYDIGTGSGIIGITALKHLPSAQVYASDIIIPESRLGSPRPSPRSGGIALARKNAEIQGVSERIRFFVGNLLDAYRTPADFIVSNPPYIPTSLIDTLQPEIRLYEPRNAIDGGEDGMLYISKLIKDSPSLLKSKGMLLMEISPEQERKTREKALKTFHSVYFIKDYSGKSRVVLCKSPKV